MGLRDILKKKDHLDNGDTSSQDAVDRLAAPEFKFIRSDTHSQEVIHPPTGPLNEEHPSDQFLNPKDGNGNGQKPRRSLDVFFGNRSRSGSVSSQASSNSNQKNGGGGGGGGGGRRLSERLHLSRSPASSENVPQDLPEIITTSEVDESQWEKRATMLASANKSRPASPRDRSPTGAGAGAGGGGGGQGAAVSSPAIDGDIQEAIRLHEAGDFENSTAMFARLADPKGANNTLSQFLYGLSLRHGWGCEPDPEGAIKYLSAAASNAAAVEQMALKAGLKKGGAAKGELVLAIFELANSFRHGWGTSKDPIAAKQYYETAANLGDTDAMNEVAWCYLEGFGCKKDKFAAARYYRLAEKNGNKTLGNSWIWKEKYDPDAGKAKNK
ncbi:Protein DSF2 [Colletotrichum orbiculare MAFF 240422]|uniref:Protein DSF2 n=1 Tax=Colletotrichum orbiculare (strain 104-T / ATCC 96160 / CBS 514.97 / LARS 414 / MAFF 240422) TaxID=1213857 RepID=A0A484G235_COLOR|nr:Protein DSF2 [Colletotrichum orbiculare MAFF 240422]